MARLTCVSGLGGKLPAAFLLETPGTRLLLDLGEGPEPGVLPDVSRTGPVDAILVTHAHQDHCGGLVLSPALGDPPVYATDATFRLMDAGFGPDLVPAARRRTMPERGSLRVGDLTLLLGRSGHAPGGVWVHADVAGGILYTGDWSRESALLTFDHPPPARLLVTDASYGDRDEPLPLQIDRMARAVAGGAVLPVPAAGRGPDVALALAARGLAPRLCPRIATELADFAREASPGAAKAATRLLRTQSGADWTPSDIIVAAGPNGEAGLSASLLVRLDEGFRFLFSSHVPAGTPAHRLLREGRAEWLAWNVHPCLSDTLRLVRETGAARVVPVFADPAAMPRLLAALGDLLALDPDLDLGASPPAGRPGTLAT